MQYSQGFSTCPRTGPTWIYAALIAINAQNNRASRVSSIEPGWLCCPAHHGTFSGGSPTQAQSAIQHPTTSRDRPLLQGASPSQAQSAIQLPATSRDPTLPQGASPTQAQSAIQHPATSRDRPLFQGASPTQAQSAIQHPATSRDRPLLQGASPSQAQSAIQHPVTSRDPTLLQGASPTQAQSAIQHPATSRDRPLLQGASPSQAQSAIQHPATSHDPTFLQGASPTQAQSAIQHPATLRDPTLLQGASPTQAQSATQHPATSQGPTPTQVHLDNTDAVEDAQDLAKQLKLKQRDLTKWEDNLRRRENNNNEMSKELAAARVLRSKLEYELKQERRSNDLRNLAKPNNGSDQPPVLPQPPHSIPTSNLLPDTTVPPPSNPLPGMSAPTPIPMGNPHPNNHGQPLYEPPRIYTTIFPPTTDTTTYSTTPIFPSPQPLPSPTKPILLPTTPNQP